MGFAIRTTPEQLRRRLMEYHDKIIADMTEAYIMACTEAVNRARSTNTYKDQTNNLRSSIGFALYYDGQIVHQDFITKGTGTGGATEVSDKPKGETKTPRKTKTPKDISGLKGIQRGENLANEVAQKYMTGFVAVIVAGMPYAAYVEAMGLDVLTGSIFGLRVLLQKHFNIINRQHGTKYRALKLYMIPKKKYYD
jgi:hypothetical protein